MSEHSPGPWEIQYDGNRFATAIADADGSMIFGNFCVVVGSNESFRDLQLTSSAPDLRDTCEDLIGLIGELLENPDLDRNYRTKIVHRAWGVIAKAEGRS